MERGSAKLIDMVRIGSDLEQSVDYSELTILRCEMEWSPAVLRFGVWLGPNLKQLVDYCQYRTSGTGLSRGLKYIL
jgi:hypothetical protein